MSYNFKSLADVELLDSMPENANVIVEIDGATRRAPKEDGIGKLVAVESLDKVPEGATVLVEIDGEIKRVPSNGLGSKTLIIKNENYDNVIAGVMIADMEYPNYTANMTYAEVLETLVKCEPINGYVYNVYYDEGNGKLAAGMNIMLYLDYDQTQFEYKVPVIFVGYAYNNDPLYWTAEGGLSAQEPEYSNPPS